MNDYYLEYRLDLVDACAEERDLTEPERRLLKNAIVDMSSKVTTFADWECLENGYGRFGIHPFGPVVSLAVVEAAIDILQLQEEDYESGL